MAELKISQLPDYTALEANDDDVLPVVDQQSGTTKKISLFELDKRWKALPNAGTINQVLAKLSNVDGDVQWLTLSKSMFGLGQVNNTADIDKPLSTAMINALNDKATVASVGAKADKSYVDTELANKIDKPATGTDGQVLTLQSGVATWADPAGSTGIVKNYGDPALDGSWRQRVDGTAPNTSFKTEVKVLGGWVTVSELFIP